MADAPTTGTATRIAGALVAHPGRVLLLALGLAAVVVFPEDRPADRQLADRLTEGVRRVMADYPGPERLVLSGNPSFTVDVARTLEREQGRFGAITVVVLAAVLALCFRSVWAVALPLAATAIAATWVLGALAAAGRSVSVLTTILPSLLLAVGVAYGVHVLHRYAHAPGGPRERARAALGGVARATLLSAATTMAGFAALASSPIDAIREFGSVAAGAIAAAAASVLLLLPAALAGARARLAPPGRSPLSRRTLAGLERLALGHGTAVLVAGALLASVAGLGATRLAVDTAYVDFLAEDHPANRDRREILARLAGPIPLRVVLDAGRADGALEPDVLARVAAFQAWAEALPHVHASYSLVDLLSEMNRAWHADEPGADAARRPPESAELAAQYLLLYESSRFAQDLERLVSFDRDRLAVWLRTELYRSADAEATLATLDARAVEAFPDLAPEVTGTLAMLFRSSDDIALGQAGSLLLALVAIGVVVMAVFRSARLGAIAAVPNLLPVLLMFGIMGFGGVPLNVGTCVVACLCLGVAADDTIHFVLAWRRAVADGADGEAAVRRAFAEVGAPILWTSVALFAGFGVLVASEFQPIAHLGWLSASTMISCVLGDLILLPALLARWGGASEGRRREPRA